MPLYLNAKQRNIHFLALLSIRLSSAGMCAFIMKYEVNLHKNPVGKYVSFCYYKNNIRSKLFIIPHAS
jgi:hypothetical protein